MQHRTILDLFEDFNNDTNDDDDDDSVDDRDNGKQHVKNISESMENAEDNDTIHARAQPLYEEPLTRMEGTKSSIKKFMDDTLEDAIGDDIEELHHLHSIMLTVATNIRRICVQKETSTSHVQAVFSSIDNGDGNSILHKKDWRERMTGSKKKKRTSCIEK